MKYNFDKKLAENIKKVTKSFYAYVKGRAKAGRSTGPPLVNDQNPTCRKKVHNVGNPMCSNTKRREVSFFSVSFLPTKDLAPFSYTYPTKKPSFKPKNDQLLVPGIC